jgi:uncharacterized Zn finger protein (UPF0148 family)
VATNYPCPGCSADLKWSPGDGDLQCPYCGHTGSAPVSEQATAPAPNREVVEHSLASGLQQATRGWGASLSQHRCSGCGAVTAVPAEVTATACAFCGTTKIAEYTDAEGVLRPESLLPFAVDERTAKAGFRKWVGGLWFRPSSLKSMSRLEKISGVYVPVWTFDTRTTNHWNAEAGFYYYVQESTTDAQGKATTKKVRKTRWEPASGTVHADFDDHLVQASAGLDQKLFEGLFPYDTSMLQPFETKYLAGFMAERYQISLKEGWSLAQVALSKKITAKCRGHVPGDTQRGLMVSTRWQDITFKHCLLPVWVAAYRHGDKVYQYVVNGVTGKTHGTAPWSWVKIAAFSVAVLGAIGAVIGIIALLNR